MKNKIVETLDKIVNGTNIAEFETIILKSEKHKKQLEEMVVSFMLIIGKQYNKEDAIKIFKEYDKIWNKYVIVSSSWSNGDHCMYKNVEVVVVGNDPESPGFVIHSEWTGYKFAFLEELSPVIS